MRVTKKESRTIKKAITHWHHASLIDDKLADELGRDLEISTFDWGRLAKYCFWIAIICIVIALSAVFANKFLRELLERIFRASDAAKCLALVVLAAAIYWLGVRRRSKHPERVFSNEAIFFFGVLTTAGAIVEFAQAIDIGDSHFSLLILLSSLIYGVLGFFLKSNLIWLFSLLSLGGWMGAETGYASGWGEYYLGMNFPMRFTIFGAVLTAAGLAIENVVQFDRLYRTTLVMGLLYLFISLWLMSIFGNYGKMESWYRAGSLELFQWSVLFAVVACGAIYHGLRYENPITKGFGLTFLFINLYTRYFEYFWNITDKAIFFGLLGISFWAIGRKAETIWNLGKEPKAVAEA